MTQALGQDVGEVVGLDQGGQRGHRGGLVGAGGEGVQLVQQARHPRAEAVVAPLGPLPLRPRDVAAHLIQAAHRHVGRVVHAAVQQRHAQVGYGAAGPCLVGVAGHERLAGQVLRGALERVREHRQVAAAAELALPGLQHADEARRQPREVGELALGPPAQGSPHGDAVADGHHALLGHAVLLGGLVAHRTRRPRHRSRP